MRTLPKPTENPKKVFLRCVSSVDSHVDRARLVAIAPAIAIAAKQYESAAAAGALFAIPRQTTIGTITNEEMKSVYTYRMVTREQPGRAVYEKILSSCAQCPLCAQREVKTLDHYLPVSAFSAFAVLPINLIPACRDCNTTKRATVPTTAEEQTLHPYYDAVDTEQWLFAKVIENSPAALSFAVRPPIAWPDVTAARVRHHFSLFGLASLYTTHAAVELSNIRYRMQKLHGSGGANSVAAELQGRADSCAHSQKNSWQTAFYQALAASAWYCDRGFG